MYSFLPLRSFRLHCRRRFWKTSALEADARVNLTKRGSPGGLPLGAIQLGPLVAIALAVTTAAAAAAIFLRAGFVDGHVASVEFAAVQGVDGAFRFGIDAHLDKSEALGAAGVAVGNEADPVNGSVLFKY